MIILLEGNCVLFYLMPLQTETAREEYECLKAVQSEEMHAQLKKIDTAEMVRLCVSVSCALKFMLYIMIHEPQH